MFGGIKQMFQERLVQLLDKNHITAAKLASDIGISSALAYQWKSGRQKASAKNIALLAEYFGVSPSYFVDGDRSSQQENISVKIPVYGKISAGIPMEAIEDIIDYEEIPAAMASRGEYMALQVKGNSMEPRMYTGDIVIIRKQEDCESGQICAVLINGEEAVIKKVVKRTNGITLVSLNTAYEPRNFSNDEIRSRPVSIIGVAVEVRGKL